MSATLNAGSFRSDDTLYGVSRTLKSYLRSILMHKHGIRLIPKSANGSRVGSRRGSGFDDADVSSILPIIPYGGFSPVRLEGRLSRRRLPRPAAAGKPATIARIMGRRPSLLPSCSGFARREGKMT